VHGHRGRKGDPLSGIRLILRCGAEKLTDKQTTRLATAIAADERYDEVHVAWLCAQQPREAYRCENLAEGRKTALKVLDSFPTCPIPEIKRLGKTLKQWRTAFLAYFDTGRANNGGAEAINGLIELHRRIARGFRNYDNYRLRTLLVGGGLISPHLKEEEPHNVTPERFAFCHGYSVTGDREVKQQLPDRIGRVVDGPARAQADLPGGELIGNRASIGQRPSQPVQLGHHQRVPRTTGRERLPQARAFAVGASQAVVDVDPLRLDTEAGQPVTLRGRVLLIGGASGVPDK